MTRLQPGYPGDHGQDDAQAALSDEELAEVISEAVTSEVVACAERELLGAAAVELTDAQRIANLERDRQLVEVLASTGFEGRVFKVLYRKLTSQLIEYASPIMRSWIRSGAIFGECLQYRGRIHPDAIAAALEWTAADRDDVVLDSIVAATDFFLEYALRQRKWDYRRGAALTTYFVGSCVCCFIKICNNRWKQRQVEEAFVQSALRAEDDDTDHLDLIESIPDSHLRPDEVAILRHEAARHWGRISDPVVQEVLALRMQGWTQSAAATEVGLTAKAAERRLHTQRRKLRPPTMTATTDDEGRA